MLCQNAVTFSDDGIFIYQLKKSLLNLKPAPKINKILDISPELSPLVKGGGEAGGFHYNNNCKSATLLQ